jgi:hypothetical protein
VHFRSSSGDEDIFSSVGGFDLESEPEADTPEHTARFAEMHEAQSDIPTRTLFVGNIQPSATDEQIYEVLQVRPVASLDPYLLHTLTVFPSDRRMVMSEVCTLPAGNVGMCW